MGKIANQLNYMHIGSFFMSKITQSAGIAAIILKQWGFEWYWYVMIIPTVIVVFLFMGWLGVKTNLWSAFQKQQFKGSLLKGK